jgi:hypothetical protein
MCGGHQLATVGIERVVTETRPEYAGPEVDSTRLLRSNSILRGELFLPVCLFLGIAVVLAVRTKTNQYQGA